MEREVKEDSMDRSVKKDMQEEMEFSEDLGKRVSRVQKDHVQKMSSFARERKVHKVTTLCSLPLTLLQLRATEDLPVKMAIKGELCSYQENQF